MLHLKIMEERSTVKIQSITLPFTLMMYLMLKIICYALPNYVKRVIKLSLDLISVLFTMWKTIKSYLLLIRAKNIYLVMTNLAKKILNVLHLLRSGLWHCRLGHASMELIRKLSHNEQVCGLSKLKFQNDHLCDARQMGKQINDSLNLKILSLPQAHFDYCIWIYLVLLRQLAL